MPEITLKNAGPKDIPALVGLDAQAFNRDYDNHFTVKELEEVFAKKGETGFIVDENKTVGYFSWVELDPDKAEIVTIAIVPEHQRKKIGTETLKKIMEKLKSYGKIKIVTHPRNIVALFLYIRNGFIINGYAKDYYGPEQDRVLLEYKR